MNEGIPHIAHDGQSSHLSLEGQADLDKRDVDIIMDSLEQELAFEGKNVSFAGSLEGTDDGLEDVAAPFVVDELDELDTSSRNIDQGMGSS